MSSAPSASTGTASFTLPGLPCSLKDFIPHLGNSRNAVYQNTKAFRGYESKLREIYAQDPESQVLSDHYINAVPLFAGHEDLMRIRSRNPKQESQNERNQYLLPLSSKLRREEGTRAVVSSLQEFQTNFSTFSESMLRNFDWSNVVVAGSAVTSCLLPVGPPNNESQRTLRSYYHEKFAPAADIDLFLYGLDEDAAVKKLEQIESNIRDNLLCETTTVRTKNAITIVSQYPNRHVQVVLRLYKSLSEILTGFDVDCSCAVYDGSQVWLAPRAIASFVTQTNTIDLTRRSPSYENRLAKYSHRGFEVHWPLLDRSRIDPTIFERSFRGVQGLARLLVLEALPLPQDRDDYRDRRREERGRPQVTNRVENERKLPGNIKDNSPDEVADWADDDEHASNYHTFAMPYGPKYNAKRIEKLLFTKDLLLNAEWNRPKDREIELHRHPAFFGNVKDVIEDCCGYCPKAETEEEIEVAEEEGKTYISGRITFIKDDPGRQAIGSFNPITDGDWTEMAYVSNTSKLCQAIVDQDFRAVQEWCQQSDANVNLRDHTGRTPLHLAVQCSSPEIVQCLIDHDARMIARLSDGQTAFHLAVRRGNIDMIATMIERSHKNKAEAESLAEAQAKSKQEHRPLLGSKKASSRQNHGQNDEEDDSENSDGSEESDVLVENEDDSASQAETEFSFIKVMDNPGIEPASAKEEKAEDPDVLDPAVPAWDYSASPLHLAIVHGHVDVVRMLIDRLDADIQLPLVMRINRQNVESVTLNPVLASRHAPNRIQMVKEVINLGAYSAQADINEGTVFHHIVNDENLEMIQLLWDIDRQNVKKALNHVNIAHEYQSILPMFPLLTSINLRNTEIALKLLEYGAHPLVSHDTYVRACRRWHEIQHKRSAISRIWKSPEAMLDDWKTQFDQPIIQAVMNDMPVVARKLVDMGADANEVTAYSKRKEGLKSYYHSRSNAREHKSVLDLVCSRIDALQQALDNWEVVPEESIAKERLTFLKGDTQYLEGLDPGSYQSWRSRGQLHSAELAEERLRREFDKKNSKLLSPLGKANGKKEKKEEIESALRDFRSFEEYLKGIQAKPFTELFPNIELPKNNAQDTQNALQESRIAKDTTPFRIQFIFKGVDPDSLAHKAYIRLFEAAWKGDAETIKSLTLSSWWIDEEGDLVLPKIPENKTQKPLEIAVQDAAGFSVFSLAVIQGHYGVAKLVIEIAAAQYKPQHGAKTFRYSLEPVNLDYYVEEYDDYDSDGRVPGLEGFFIRREVVENELTTSVKDLDALSDTVSSTCPPLSMLNWHCELWQTYEDPKAAKTDGLSYPLPDSFYSVPWRVEEFSLDHFKSMVENAFSGTRNSLLQYAILKDDQRMFAFLVELGQNLLSREKPNELDPARNLLDQETIHSALRLGRLGMVQQAIKTTGYLLPLSKLTTGTNDDDEEDEGTRRKPKYYQGLSVYGKKRKDWAAPQNENPAAHYDPGVNCPLKSVTASDNLEAFKFFYEGGVLASYMGFLNKYKNDKRIRFLSRREGGIEGVLKTWLGTTPYLAMREAVAGAIARPSSGDLLENLLKIMPEAINAKDKDDAKDWATPLNTAFLQQSAKVAKLLLENGADPYLRDKHARNILHDCFQNAGRDKTGQTEKIKELFSLLSSQTVTDLLMQRSTISHGSHTPISAFLSDNPRNPDLAEILTLTSSYTKGLDLELMNASGELPIHHAVRLKQTRIVRHLLSHRPTLLYIENAVGITPLELVNDAFLRFQLSGNCQWRSGRATVRGGRAARRAWYGGYQDNGFMLKKRGQYPQGHIAKQTGYITLPEIDPEFFLEESKGQGEDEEEDSDDLLSAHEVCTKIARTIAQEAETEAATAENTKIATIIEVPKRKLVTLHEANEMVKRLAEMQRKRKRKENGGNVYGYGNGNGYYGSGTSRGVMNRWGNIGNRAGSGSGSGSEDEGESVGRGGDSEEGSA